jgi:hypothetical protein
MFADQKGLDVTITSIKSGRELIHTVSQTHEEGRAIDIRSRDWPEKTKKELVEKLNNEMGHLGAIGLFTGERKVIILEEDTGHGEHFHVQVSKLIRNTEDSYVRRQGQIYKKTNKLRGLRSNIQKKTRRIISKIVTLRKDGKSESRTYKRN